MQAHIRASPLWLHDSWISTVDTTRHAKRFIHSCRLAAHLEHVHRWKGKRRTALGAMAMARTTDGKVKSKTAQGPPAAKSSKDEDTDPLGGQPDSRGFRAKDYVLFQQSGLENVHALLHGNRYLLAEGDEGDDVKGLQEYLASTGHFKSSVGCTGYFGAATKDAVGAWQKDHGVVISGQFGPISMDTLKALLTKEVVRLRKAEEKRAEEKRREEKRAEDRLAEEKRREEKREQDRIREEKKQEVRRLRQASKLRGKRGSKEEVVEEVEEGAAAAPPPPPPPPPPASLNDAAAGGTSVGKGVRQGKGKGTSGDKDANVATPEGNTRVPHADSDADVAVDGDGRGHSPSVSASVAVPTDSANSPVKLGVEALGLGFLGTIIVGLIFLGCRELWILFIEFKARARLEGEKRDEMREIQRKRFVARVKRIIEEDRDDGPPTGTATPSASATGTGTGTGTGAANASTPHA